MQINKLIFQRIAGLSLLVGLVIGAQSAASASCDDIDAAITAAGGVGGVGVYGKLGNAMTDGKTLGKGLPFAQWGTIVDNHGVVCAVVNTGSELGEQWFGSRAISAQKANTALDYSITRGLALSTANLWAATQPGGSLFGLQFSNPVDTTVAYGDNSDCKEPGCDAGGDPGYGTLNDPMVGRYIGGNNVFGGGLPLYDQHGNLIGGLGTSGNTSCTDHYISWIVRSMLKLDHVPAGVAPGNTDNIIFDITGSHGNFQSKSGYGQPLCGVDPDEANYPNELMTNYPVQPVQQ